MGYLMCMYANNYDNNAESVEMYESALTQEELDQLNA